MKPTHFRSRQQNIEFDSRVNEKSNSELLCRLKINLLVIAASVLLVFTPQLTQAQIKYKAKVRTISGKQLSGQILRITQDSLFLKNNTVPGQIVIAGSEINSLRISKKGAVGKGFLIGATTGIILGGVIGYASYTPPDCSSGWCFDFGPEYDAYGGALLGFVAGSLIGTAIGSSGKVFTSEMGKGILDQTINYIDTNSSNSKNPNRAK